MRLGILSVGVELIIVVHIANTFCKCICALFMSKRNIQIVSMAIVHVSSELEVGGGEVLCDSVVVC